MTFREILDKYGVTASELSRKSGVPTSTLSTFASGRSKCQNMQITTFLKICRGLNVSFEMLINDLFDGEENDLGTQIPLSGDEESLVNDFRGFNAQAKSCLIRVSSAMKMDPTNAYRPETTETKAEADSRPETNEDSDDASNRGPSGSRDESPTAKDDGLSE